MTVLAQHLLVPDHSHTQCYLPHSQHQEANSILLVQEDIHLPMVSGVGSGPIDLNKPIKHVQIILSPTHPPEMAPNP